MEQFRKKVSYRNILICKKKGVNKLGKLCFEIIILLLLLIIVPNMAFLFLLTLLLVKIYELFIA